MPSKTMSSKKKQISFEEHQRDGPQLDHASRGHALLTASGSHRWMNCTPSARLEAQFPNKSSIYAEQGTAVHEFCEYLVRKDLHERVQMPQSEFYTEEALNNAEIYREFVAENVEKIRNEGLFPMVLVEERLDFSNIVPGGFGTGDCLILAPGKLHIIDYKNGHHMVDAHRNSQLMLYALGALNMYDYLFNVQEVSMSIVQPRVENISTYTCTKEELVEWGENVKPIARIAYEGKGEQKPGEWCFFCKAKALCKACADEALALCREEFLDLDAGAFAEDPRAAPADVEESDTTAPYTPDMSAPTFKQPGLVSLDELTEILPTLNRISSWIESVFAFISSEAINHSVPIRGYKVVEGRSKRVFTDTKAVVETATQNGYTDLYKQQLISLTEFEKMMGKKKFIELLGEYVAKPPGKLALVPESDPRPPVDLSNGVGGVTEEFEVLGNE